MVMLSCDVSFDTTIRPIGITRSISGVSNSTLGPCAIRRGTEGGSTSGNDRYEIEPPTDLLSERFDAHETTVILNRIYPLRMYGSTSGSIAATKIGESAAKLPD